jgi:hypothetical protein
VLLKLLLGVRLGLLVELLLVLNLRLGVLPLCRTRGMPKSTSAPESVLLSASVPVAVVVVVVVNRPVVVVVADRVLVDVRVDVVSGESERDLRLASPEEALLRVGAGSSGAPSEGLALLTRGLAPPLMRTKWAWSLVLARGEAVLMPRAPLPDDLGDARGVEALPVDEFESVSGGDGESDKSAEVGM